MKILHVVRYSLMFALLCLVALYYHPDIAGGNHAGEAVVNPLHNYVILLTFVVLSLTASMRQLFNHNFIKFWFFFVLLVLFQAIILFAFDLSSDYINDLLTVSMALSFLAIGYCLDLSKKEFAFLSAFYFVAISYCVFMQIITFIGGFVIEDQYAVVAKNSLGVILASSFIGCISIALSKDIDENAVFRIFLCMIAFFLLALLLTIRARTSTLSIFIFLIYYYFRTHSLRNLNLTRVLILLLPIIILGLLLFNTSLGEFVYNSFTQNRDSDVTSDRGNRNFQALSVIMSDPLFGNLTVRKEMEWVHNYFLRIWSDYGLFFGSTLLILYTYIVVYLMKKWKRINVKSFANIGYLVVMAPMFSSLAEPTFPYGPGTVVLYSFIALGYSMNHENKICSYSTLSK